MDRATASGAVCRGFESLRVRFFIIPIYYFFITLYVLFPLFLNIFLYFFIFFLLHTILSFLFVFFNEFLPVFRKIFDFTVIFFNLWQFWKQFLPINFTFFPIVTFLIFLQFLNAPEEITVILYFVPLYFTVAGTTAFLIFLLRTLFSVTVFLIVVTVLKNTLGFICAIIFILSFTCPLRLMWSGCCYIKRFIC